MTKSLAIVTGGARGIGRAISERLAEDGFSVVAIDREAETADLMARELRARGLDVTAEILDLTDHAALARMVARYPVPYALVNNAGIFYKKDFFETTAADFRQVYEVNLISMFVLSQLVAGKMSAGSRIVNIASRAFMGAAHMAYYAAAKGAVVSLTRSLAIEFVKKPILVNAVAPGAIETAMTMNQTAEQKIAVLASQPMGKLGRPEDIANAVSFLAAPRTDFITGQTLVVDGGKSLGVGFG